MPQDSETNLPVIHQRDSEMPQDSETKYQYFHAICIQANQVYSLPVIHDQNPENPSPRPNDELSEVQSGDQNLPSSISGHQDDNQLSLAERRTRREIRLPNRLPYNVAPIRKHADTAAIIRAFVTITNDENPGNDEPTVEEAKRSKQWPEWLAAMHQELASLELMKVYEEVDSLPPGKKAVGSKWVLIAKRDENGEITRHRARLVAQGYTQVPGQDFTYTFAPVARWDSIRFILCLAALHDWELRHIDIKSAYLNGVLKEEVYLKRPEIVGPGYWRLFKALYGLRQSGREWYFEISGTYNEMGMIRCESDWSVHHRERGPDKSITATSVDDIILAANSVAESNRFTEQIQTKYAITDNGDAHWVLGCKITRWRSRGCLKLDQEQYVTSILQQFGMSNCNPVFVPMANRLTTEMCPKTESETVEANSLPYKQAVGKLMYLATCTRPDIAFTVRELAKYMSNYGSSHWAAVKHLLRYLQGTRSAGIIYGNIDEPYPIFKTFTDSDWAQSESRKSICGYIVEMNGGPIAWSSKQQVIIALSSCEAEYIASTHAAKEVLWIRYLAQELGFTQKDATPLYCDNQGTVACTHDPHHHSKMKHVDIRYHFVRNCVQNRLIDVIHVAGIENIADLLTKPLTRFIHDKWLRRLRMDRDQGGVLKDIIS
jgi:hypothetical protein